MLNSILISTLLISVPIIALIATILVAMSFRRVVPTNMVHIVQSKKKRTSYGSESNSGNVYYQWPSWIPVIGVTVIQLPVSVFDLSLDSYSAYDKDRVPFVVDITAFFRISDTNLASERAASVRELQSQLTQIVQGAVRKILASDIIDSIMGERSKFGEQFTTEIESELASWGVVPVKNMELMDIRDTSNSAVIANIMAKKKSEIEKESRVVVAENMREAREREIESERDVDLREQEALQLVGQRTAEKEQAVGIADEKSKQQILIESTATAERQMEVRRVEEVKQAEIQRDREIVAAEEEKQRLTIIAEGRLAETQKESEGIRVEGEAKADAEKAMQMAPVEAQIALIDGIKSNVDYMRYLTALEAINAQRAVGMENARALESSDMKIIANSGSAPGGINSIADVFGPSGATNLAAALEALSQGEMGASVLEKFGIKKDTNDDNDSHLMRPPETVELSMDDSSSESNAM